MRMEGIKTLFPVLNILLPMIIILVPFLLRGLDLGVNKLHNRFMEEYKTEITESRELQDAYISAWSDGDVSKCELRRMKNMANDYRGRKQLDEVMTAVQGGA